MFIVIPFFKNARFLSETLLSVLQQTDCNWTAVVLDDSIDAIEAQAAEDCVKQVNDSRITYRKNKDNLGIAANWNQGIDLAKGHDFLVLLHADDCLKSDYLVQMRTLAKLYPEATGFFCRTEIIGEEGGHSFSFADWYKERLLPNEKTIVLKGLSGGARLISGNFIFCPSLCYRVSKLGRERFRSDLKMVQDFDLILRILSANGSWVGFYERPLFQYRRHAQNTTVTLSKELLRFKEEQALYLQLAETFTRANMPGPARRAKKMRVVKLNLCFQILKSVLKFDLRSFRKEFAFLLELFK